jgi:hypothetical protein
MKQYLIINKTIYLSLILVIFSNVVIAQNYVYDSILKKPIESVTISYSKTKGLTTNEDGYFELNNKSIDTLKISHIAYKTKKIVAKKIKLKDTIFLSHSSINLDEVILSSFNTKEMVQKAIEKIDKNYLNVPYNSFGFFRQSLQEDNKGVEMIEVDFISYIEDNKSSYSTKITNARRTGNFSKLGIETYGGVLAVIENGDFVRRKSYFLNKKNLDNYIFLYEGKINYNGLIVYKINFRPSDNDNLQFLRKGVLYIDSNSLAFIEINYKFDINKLMKIAQKSEINISKKRPFYRLIEVENTIKYRQLPNSEKWILSFIEANNIRKGIYKKESYLYDLNAKLVINNIKIEKAVNVKTNYNLSKNFNKAIKRFDNLQKWEDNYKFSLSNNEKNILKEIDEKAKK